MPVFGTLEQPVRGMQTRSRRQSVFTAVVALHDPVVDVTPSLSFVIIRIIMIMTMIHIICIYIYVLRVPERLVGFGAG